MKIRVLLACVVVAFVAFGAEKREGKALEKDAFYWNSLIGKGVNLGDALEAPEEGKWEVRLEEEYFELIAEAGFNSVRIPVRWSAHADVNAPYTIDKTFMARVDWAIKRALSHKLTAIVNIHHYAEIVEAPAEHKERFLAMWKQIAEHYRDYPDTVYFELLNEPCKKLTSELWNEYAEEAIRLIRKSNPIRAIIVGPASWNNISERRSLRLPRDDKNLIVTFHYYQPFEFTHQGASWAGEKSKAWVGTTWTGTEKEKQDIISHLDEAVRWAREKQVPLFMGEFGAYSKADMASRARWTAFVRSEAEKRGISWAYWEFCSGFGVYDPKEGKWRRELLDSLIGGSGTN
jgi:endoglucanase